MSDSGKYHLTHRTNTVSYASRWSWYYHIVNSITISISDHQKILCPLTCSQVIENPANPRPKVPGVTFTSHQAFDYIDQDCLEAGSLPFSSHDSTEKIHISWRLNSNSISYDSFGSTRRRTSFEVFFTAIAGLYQALRYASTLR